MYKTLKRCPKICKGSKIGWPPQFLWFSIDRSSLMSLFVELCFAAFYTEWPFSPRPIFPRVTLQGEDTQSYWLSRQWSLVIFFLHPYFRRDFPEERTLIFDDVLKMLDVSLLLNQLMLVVFHLLSQLFVVVRLIFLLFFQVTVFIIVAEEFPQSEITVLLKISSHIQNLTYLQSQV